MAFFDAPFHILLPTLLFWLASILFILAYAIRDMFWLRVLTILGCIATLPYYYFQAQPLISAAIFELIFISINTYNLIHLMQARLPVVLTQEQHKLHLKTLPNFSPREMINLLEQANLKAVTAGTLVVKQGTAHAELILIMHGQMDIISSNKSVATIMEGSFVGEMSYITNETTSANVVASTDCSYFVWQKNKLDKYLHQHLEIASQLQLALGRDMAKKLKTNNVIDDFLGAGQINTMPALAV